MFKEKAMKIKCTFGKHEYKPVLRTYDVFSTSWTDTGEKDYWHVFFLKCKCCEKRKFETNYPFTETQHSGIEKARNNWLDYGSIADTIKNAHKYQKPEEPKAKPKPESTFNGLTVSPKVAKMLMKALDTTSENEAETCLRMARKAYKK